MVVGKMPFGRATLDDKYFKTLSEGHYEHYFLRTGAQNFSDEFKDLLIKMLSMNPKNRVSINEVRNHPWMNQPVNDYEQKQYLKSLITTKEYENYDQEYLNIEQI